MGTAMADAIRKHAEEVADRVYPEPHHRHMKHAYADAFERGYREAQNHENRSTE
jgi:hypothetical protein